MLKRHNPHLESRLVAAIDTGGGEALNRLLSSLSNADFRTAGYLLGERLLPRLDGETFWRVFAAVVPESAKAYLGTFLKAAVTLYKGGHFSLADERFAAFAKTATLIDCHKTLDALLPIVRTPEDCALLINLFTTDRNIQDTCSPLVAAGTVPAYYELLQTLRRHDAPAAEVRAICLALISKADSRSFRMARLLQAYFGIGELPATFSLPLETYQLSRLEGGYEQFKAMLEH